MKKGDVIRQKCVNNTFYLTVCNRGNVGQMNHLAILVDREKSTQITSSKISHLHFLL